MRSRHGPCLAGTAPSHLQQKFSFSAPLAIASNRHIFIDMTVVSAPPVPGQMIDPFGRRVSYVRVSVTDRCDLRCVYCMAEDMTFLPKADVLSLEELERVCKAFVSLGVKKIRLTGGEPLVRRNVMSLIGNVGSLVKAGALEELTLTTNGTQLAKNADGLVAAGVRRINVSLDSLKADRFARITRRGMLEQVIDGIKAARAAGLAVKINAVALKGENEDEFDALIEFCGALGLDLCLIETMPLGDDMGDRTGQYLPLSEVRARLDKRWTLTETGYNTGGPARYVEIAETGRKLGFITPMTHNFCESCNRVRVTCTGTLYMCLGQEDAIDLRGPLRDGGDAALVAAIRQGIDRKPKGHDFIIDRNAGPAVHRHMSMTGG
jgi:cyclic pyranopterin phosphate synthase